MKGSHSRRALRQDRQLLARGVEPVLGGHQFLARLSKPLLDKGIAVGHHRGELVLALINPITIEIKVPQHLYPLIGSGEKI